MNKIVEISVVCATVFVVYLTFSIKSFYIHQDNIIKEMILDGTDPLEALCSMTDTYGTHPVCIQLASRPRD